MLLGTFVVGIHYSLHQRVPDYIRGTQRHGGDSLDPPQPRQGVDQAAVGMRRQIDLRDVAGDHDLRTGAHPRQKHLHLGNGGVLRLVEDDEGLVQRATAHVGQRYDLDQVLLGVALDKVVIDHLAQGVHQGPQIGIDLGLQVAGQIAQTFAGFDGRADQHDLAHGFLFQCRGGHGHGQIRLAGSGRPKTQHDVVLAYGVHVSRLAGRLGADLPPGFENLDGRTLPRADDRLSRRLEPAIRLPKLKTHAGWHGPRAAREPRWRVPPPRADRRFESSRPGL